MIRNQWYAVMDNKELKKGKPVGVMRCGEKLVFWRTQDDQVACMRDQCLHRGAALSAGKLVRDHIQCPFHGLEFDHTGKCTYIPSYGKNGLIPKVFKATTYPAVDAFGWIWIWWGEYSADLPAIQYFDTIDDSFGYATFSDDWPVHYSRVIENQLDAIHLPFVHFNTIGRGNKRLVDGPYTEWAEADDLRMDIWVHNRADDGTLPIPPKDMERPNRNPSLQFRFPNIWHNWIADGMRIVIAFVPIDDAHTKLYIRNYQKFSRLSLVKGLINFFAKAGSFVIERQDRRVVTTQLPLRSYHRMGEILLRGDGPVIEYRRKRDHLINNFIDTREDADNSNNHH